MDNVKLGLHYCSEDGSCNRCPYKYRPACINVLTREALARIEELEAESAKKADSNPVEANNNAHERN